MYATLLADILYQDFLQQKRQLKYYGRQHPLNRGCNVGNLEQKSTGTTPTVITRPIRPIGPPSSHPMIQVPGAICQLKC